ncbi:MAG: hypothetical protein HY424_01560 [Candidatus Levybacteria bacterium]|nr:hypothetical protein [Candidatus Levybacteria bacterium]
MSESFPSINLVKNQQVPLLDRFMSWALTVGRLIVILTEIVAVIAFIYRFSLDEKLVDLHSKIKQKQTLISLLKSDENKYRNLQDRIALAATFSEKGSKANKTVKGIIDLMPPGIKIDNFTLNKDRINIDMNIASIPQLTAFINSLKSYPEIKSISIDNIENKPSLGLLVKITTILK